MKKEKVLKSFSKLLVTLSVATISTHASTKTVKHTVKKGDTLYKIAYKNNISIAKLRKENKMKKNDDVLRLGSIIKVPTRTRISPKKKTVQKQNSQTLHTSLLNLNTFIVNETQSEEEDGLFDKFFFNTKKLESDRSRKIISIAKTKLGKKYVWGASGTKNTYDCSSFTKYVYRNFDIAIPRTSIRQSKHGTYIKRADLQKGDLIFFDTSKRKKGYVNHVGIYLGDNKFIHASSAKKKVVITSLNQKFYSQRYKGARRPS